MSFDCGEEADVNKGVRALIYNFISIALAAVFQIFFLLCLPFYRERIGESWYYVLLYGVSCLNLVAYIVSVVFFCYDKQIIYKSFLSAYLLLAFAAVVYYVLLKTGFMAIVRDAESLKAYLESKGSWMSIVFILLQFLQVIILPIPSFITVAAGSALFGPFVSSLYSLLGIVLGSIAAFCIGKYLGYPAVSWLVGEDTLKKWLKKIKGKDKLLLSAMFLLPVFPDDVLCFVAGISTMSFPFFLVVILVSRVLAIFTTSYSIHLIPFTTWWGLLIWCVFFAILLALFVVLYKKSDEVQAWFEKKFSQKGKKRGK